MYETGTRCLILKTNRTIDKQSLTNTFGTMPTAGGDIFLGISIVRLEPEEIFGLQCDKQLVGKWKLSQSSVSKFIHCILIVVWCLIRWERSATQMCFDDYAFTSFSSRFLNSFRIISQVIFHFSHKISKVHSYINILYV